MIVVGWRRNGQTYAVLLIGCTTMIFRDLLLNIYMVAIVTVAWSCLCKSKWSIHLGKFIGIYIDCERKNMVVNMRGIADAIAHPTVSD